MYTFTPKYTFVQACVRVLRHNLTEQDTWWPRSLLTALISLEISKLGSKQRDGMPPHQQSLLVLSLPIFIGFCPPQNLTSLIAAVKETQKIYNQDIKSICF